MNIQTQEDSLEIQTERRAQLQIRQKWGSAVGRGGRTGFVAIPEALLHGQKALGLTATEMMVLINVLMHWWYHDKQPFPGNGRIARRMGVSSRTVQRAFEKLEKKGLVHRDIRAFTDDDRNRTEDESVDHQKNQKTPYNSRRYLNLAGLVRRLERIADGLQDYERKK